MLKMAMTPLLFTAAIAPFLLLAGCGAALSGKSEEGAPGSPGRKKRLFRQTASSKKRNFP
jgi:hypothetical protein